MAVPSTSSRAGWGGVSQQCELRRRRIDLAAWAGDVDANGLISGGGQMYLTSFSNAVTPPAWDAGAGLLRFAAQADVTLVTSPPPVFERHRQRWIHCRAVGNAVSVGTAPVTLISRFGNIGVAAAPINLLVSSNLSQIATDAR